jgi:hypothetical protein
MNIYKRVVVLFQLAIMLFAVEHVAAQVWQWSLPVQGEKGAARAFLWIPGNCKKVRGVVLAQNNMEEISILESFTVRKALADIGFAEIWVSPSFDHTFNFNKGAGEIFNAFMKSLAFVSGYDELRYVPIVPIGHSAAASWPYYFAAWNPQRTLACISVSGQWPYFRHPQFAPDIWSKEQNIDYIPSLETMGEYEAAATWSTEGLKERKEHPLMPLSMLAAPGEGHFATSKNKNEYIAFYIKKAAYYRLHANAGKNGSFILKPINPTKTGWLAEKWLPNHPPSTPAAPVEKYTGGTAQAFWYFDEETIRKTEAYGAKYRGLKPQLIGFVQNGKMVSQKNTHLQIDLKFLPEKDGITFHLETAFYDTVPGGSPRPKDWANLPVGSPIGHATAGTPIQIEKVSGPFKKAGPNTFKIQLEKGSEATAKNYVLTFVAKHPGEAAYKPAVQQAQMVIPAKIEEGEEQKILFPAISNQKVGSKHITLKAKSTAGVPVSYYVLEGPAEVKGNELMFMKIPPMAKYPLKVSLVAWQYGLSGTRKLKTAEPVTRTFFLHK